MFYLVMHLQSKKGTGMFADFEVVDVESGRWEYSLAPMCSQGRAMRINQNNGSLEWDNPEAATAKGYELLAVNKPTSVTS